MRVRVCAVVRSVVHARSARIGIGIGGPQVKAYAALTLLALASLSCAPPKPACGVPDPDLDASPAAQRVACTRAGDRLKELSCKEARPDFVDFCLAMLAEHIPIRPSCLSTIATCADVDGKCR